jgi:putative tryptophan/tyrosine transport system substrate-binding protein
VGSPYLVGSKGALSIRFAKRWSDNDAEITLYAAELARWGPDASFVAFSPALRAMRPAQIYPSCLRRSPVEDGFVSMARPGGNITGFASGEFNIATSQLDLLKKPEPNLKPVAHAVRSDAAHGV